MSEQGPKIVRCFVLSACAWMPIWLSADSARAQPHALVPIAIPRFSLDAASPTLGGPITPGAVLKKPGPTVAFSATGLGLNNPADNLDELSSSRTDIGPTDTFVILFGVDRQTIGHRDPEPSLLPMRPYNVKHQAARHQAAADTFMTLDAYNRMGGPLAPEAFRAVPARNNTLVLNQGDSGGIDYDLSPEVSPLQGIPPEQPIDETDAMYYPAPPPSLRGVQPLNDLFFTASRNSPSLNILPGIPSGANVYFDPNPTMPGTEQLFVSAQQLGLQSGPLGDDIDGLVVIDVGDNRVLNVGIDQIFFSLTSNSPSLNGGVYSAADIFVSTGNGMKTLFARADDLGLLGTDNVDNLEFFKTSDPVTTVYESAIFLVVPGDYNGDLQLTPTDCSAFADCYSGEGNSYDVDGSVMHIVQVGPGPVFTPSNKTIESGDSIRWLWQGGLHNVVSGMNGTPDNRFTSGPPTSINGTTFDVSFSETFLNANPAAGGVYPYYCEVDANNGMIGTITVQPNVCATFDMDFDGDVDCVDWRLFQQIVRQLNGGAACPRLSIEDFVAALLDSPVLPAHTCMADMNSDDAANGLDVKPYIDGLFSP